MAYTVYGSQAPVRMDNNTMGQGFALEFINDGSVPVTAATVLTDSCAVAVTAASTCGYATGKVLGKALAILPNSHVLVQVKGVMRLEYTSTAPTIGKSITCTTAGKVLAGTSDATVSNGVVIAVNSGDTPTTVDVLL